MLVRGLSVRAWAYVVVVGALSSIGFVRGRPAPILLAAVLSFPASLITVPGYYIVYGLLAQVPGANPSNGSGSGTSIPGGGTLSHVVSGPAAWFSVTTAVIGVLALITAALLDLLLLTAVRRRR